MTSTNPTFTDLAADPALLNTATDLAAALEQLIHATELQLGCRLTIHDLADELVLADGTKLLDKQRGFHLHRRCMAAREKNAAGGSRCLAHCMRSCGARAADSHVAFHHTCWAGFNEVVIPVWWDGRHRLTLFLGPWPTPASSKLLDQAATLGRALADALAATIQRTSFSDNQPNHDRRAILHASARAGETLTHVAGRMGLSVSRASRVISAMRGQPWRQVLRNERLRQARTLLSTTNLTCAAIAESLGYATPGHFSRSFQRAEGLAPGQWRQKAKA